MKQKPNPEELGRQIVWHLCGLRAEMRILMQMFAREIEPNINKADQIYLDWLAGASRVQKSIYDEALAQIGIPPAEDQDSESSEG